MLWMLLLGLAVPVLGATFLDSSEPDEDSSQPEPESTDVGTDVEHDNENNVSPDSIDSPDFEDENAENGDATDTEEGTDWGISQLITEDTSLTLGQSELDSLMAQSEGGGQVLNYVLDNDANLSVAFDDELDGYLHTLSYTRVVEGVDGEDDTVEQHSIIVWSATQEMPTLLGDEATSPSGSTMSGNDVFLTDKYLSSDDLVGETGVVLLDIEVLRANEDYVTDTVGQVISSPYTVEAAGSLILDSESFETFLPQLNDTGFLSDTTYAMNWGDGQTCYGGEYTITQSDIDLLQQMETAPFINQLPSQNTALQVSGDIEGYLHAIQVEEHNGSDTNYYTEFYLTDSPEIPSEPSESEHLFTISGGSVEQSITGAIYNFTSEVDINTDSFATISSTVIGD